MEPDQIEDPFERVASFEWDENKRAANLDRHKIDFRDAVGVFDGPYVFRRSDRNDELRYQVFGYVQGREVAVACAIRGTGCRIISARQARRDERRKYHDRITGQPDAG